MFSIQGNETQLTCSSVREFFGRCVTFGGDASLSALYRAIVLERNQNESIQNLANLARVATKRVGDEMDLRWTIGEEDNLKNEGDGTLQVVVVTSDNLSWDFDFLTDRLDREDWIAFDGAPYYVDKYLSRFARTRIFANTKYRKTFVVVARGADAKWINALESMLWAILPWYYPERSDEIVSFFRTISVDNIKTEADAERAKQAIITYANRVAKLVDFRDMGLHNYLDGIEDAMRTSQLENVQATLESLNSDIESLMARLAGKYDDLENTQVMYKALLNSPVGECGAMFKFFKEHKCLSIIERSGVRLTYSVSDTLDYYDVDEANSILTEKRSWAYGSYSNGDLEYLKELFVNKRGIVRVSAGFILNDLKLVRPQKDYCYDQTSMPNPHIFFYACSGANDAYYAQFAKSGEWDLAIEQSIGATKNWNTGDSAVGRRMFDWIVNHGESVPFIYVSDGSPIEKVTDDMRLVTFDEFKNIVEEAKKREAKASESEA